MMLSEEAPVASALLPLAEFKAHLRMGSGFAEDSLQDTVLESFLRAALAAVEARTGKAVLQRQFRLELDAWRDAMALRFPVAPVNALDSFALVDLQGVETAQNLSDYRLQPDPHHPVLLPVSGAMPSLPEHSTAKLLFQAGYAAAWADLPPDLAQAVLMLAAHYYEYRHDTGLGEGCTPFGVTSLLERYRPVRIGTGGRA